MGHPRHRIGRYIPWEFDFMYDEFIDGTPEARPVFPPPPAGDVAPVAGESPPSTVGRTLEAHGPWDLPLAGFEVLQVTFAYPIDLVAYGPDGVSASLRFEGDFSLIEAGANESHESWNVTAPDFRLIALPGGSVAVF